MPQGFGDTFVQSMQFGSKLAQEEEQIQQQKNQFEQQTDLAKSKLFMEARQHAQAVDFEEKKLEATQTLEGLKMDALNREITQRDKQHAETMKYNYEHDAQELREKQLTDFNSQFAMITPQQAKDYGIEAVKGSSLQKLYNRLPLAEQANTLYTDTRTMGIIQAMEAQRKLNDVKEAPLKEADTLTSDFDKVSLPETILTKTRDTYPGIIEGLANAYRGMGIPKTATETYQEVNSTGIKDYLNKQADIVGKMIPRAKGENFPLYGSSIGTYTNMAENLLKTDENGNISFDSKGLNPTAARIALYSIASSHKTGYLNAMIEAEATRKATATTDKSQAEEEYQIAISNAQKQYPLYKEAIGQAFGQRYTKQ